MIDLSTTSVEHYLTAVSLELAGAPSTARAAVLDDLRAHIEDALEAGRPLDTVLAGLGDPHTVAADYLKQAGLVPTASRLSWWYDLITLLVAILAMVIGVVEAARDTMPGVDPDTGLPMEESMLGAYNGLGVLVLTLVPVLAIAALLFVPLARRNLLRLILAGVFTVGLLYRTLVWSANDVFYAVISALTVDPAVVFALWGGVFLAIWLRSSRPRALALTLRLIAAAVLIYVGALGLGAAGGFTADAIPSLILSGAWIVVGVLFAFGIRWGYLLGAVLAAVVMIMALISTSPFAMLNWVAASVALVMSLTAWFGTAPRLRATSKALVHD